MIGLTQRSLPNNAQRSQETDINAPGGIRTRNPNKRAFAHPRLRPCWHCDRHIARYEEVDFAHESLVWRPLLASTLVRYFGHGRSRGVWQCVPNWAGSRCGWPTANLTWLWQARVVAHNESTEKPQLSWKTFFSIWHWQNCKWMVLVDGNNHQHSPARRATYVSTLHWGAFAKTSMPCKSDMYYIFWVCVCNFTYPVC